ncbi:MAG: PEP-CTERM sorting domain-containing protein [Pirellulales bacterium]
MKTTFQFLAAALILAAVARPAFALDEREPIVGTIELGKPIDLYYDNHLEPLPHKKVIQFQGDAIVLPGLPPGLLEIFFDYIDENGNEVFPPLGHTQFPIAATGQPIPVSVGPLILPFCPERVSIHIRSLEAEGFGAPIELNGIFAHACITVPEPSSLVLASLATVGMLFVGIRRRRAG